MNETPRHREQRSDSDRPCPVSRRSFLAAAGVGVSGLFAGTAGASTPTTQSVMTDEYAFVADRVGSGERIPTLIHLFDRRGFAQLEDYGTDVRTTEDPWPAAFARLTPAEAEELAQLPLISRLRFSPGSNPFWKHFDYPDRVFPDPTDALDYVAYEEAVDGLEHLAEEYPNRLTVERFGASPGLDNRRLEDAETYDMVLAELSDDVDSIDEKRVVVNSLSIHGDERSGVEAGLRLIEGVLRGEEPDLDAWLDEVGLVFVLSNPDGWMARHPETVSAASSSRDTFTRVNGSNLDPNRQYPTAGLIDPNAYPGEPNGQNLENDDPDGIDDDVETQYEENVPDTLWLVHELRRYDDVAYAADFHGMYGSEQFVLGMQGNAEYGPREQAAVDALNERIDGAFDAEIAPLMDEYGQAIDDAASDRGIRQTPSEPYEYGTIADTIDYNVSGSMGGWLGKAVEMGGLGATAISYEMAIDNARTAAPVPFNGGLVTVQAAAYQICMRQLARAAAEGVDGAIETGGRSVAYVDSPSLTRSSDDVSTDAATTFDRDGATIDAASGRGGHAIRIDRDVHTLSLSITEREGRIDAASLIGPDGDVVRSGPIGERPLTRGANWIVTDPEPGRWRVRVRGDGGAAALDYATVSAQGRPDPGIMAYEQREYTVTPIDFLADYGEAMADGTATSLDVDDVASGALVSGGQPAYDQLVLIHDDGLTDGAYVSAIEEYVAAGGDLVLTDSGAALLGALDVDGTGSIGAGDVQSTTARFARLESTRNHPLVEDVRSLEKELWTGPTIGYSTSNEAPLHVVDENAFRSAGGEVAATASGGVIAGGLGSITVVGSLLPPATQDNMHPFGMANYATTALGMRVFRAALDHEQRR